MHTDGKEPHAIAMKAQIQSGDVSNPKNIEESTESARTGILSVNTRVSSIKINRTCVLGSQSRVFLRRFLVDGTGCRIR